MTLSKQYLLDTNVVSELYKPHRNPQVTAFLDACDPSATFISIMTLGELRRGAALKRRSDLDASRRVERWIDSLERTYVTRVLDVSGPIARKWGELSSDRTRPIVDTLLAATAITHDLTLVTRNTKDFADTGVPLLNPWHS